MWFETGLATLLVTGSGVTEIDENGDFSLFVQLDLAGQFEFNRVGRGRFRLDVFGGQFNKGQTVVVVARASLPEFDRRAAGIGLICSLDDKSRETMELLVAQNDWNRATVLGDEDILLWLFLGCSFMKF